MFDDKEILTLLRGPRDQLNKGARSLFTKYSAELRRFVAARGGGNEVDDIVQRTMVAAVTKIAQFSGEGAFKAWLWAIARNETLQVLRARAAQPEEVKEEFDPTLFGLSDALWRSDKMTENSIVLCVRRGIEAFSSKYPQHAEAILLVACLRWHQRDLAQYLARSYDATRAFLSEARRKLRPFISHCLGGPDKEPTDDYEIVIEATEKWVGRLTGSSPDEPRKTELRDADALKDTVDALFIHLSSVPSNDLHEARQLKAFEVALANELQRDAAPETSIWLRYRGVMIAASFLIVSGSGMLLTSSYSPFASRGEKALQLVEATPGFEAGTLVRSASSPQILRVSDPQNEVRRVMAGLRGKETSFRLMTNGSVWQLEILSARMSPELIFELERLGVIRNPDRPILTVRFEPIAGK